MNPLTNVRNIERLNDNDLRNGIFDHSVTWHSQYKDSAYIFVGGLPYDLSEGDVLCVFSQYGEIVNVNLVRDKKTGKTKGFAFICYEDQRSSILAVDNLNNIKLGGRTLRVDHVSEYRAPKEDEKGADGRAIDKVETGCAPRTPSPPPIDVEFNKSEKKKKKKDKKKKKKKDKEKDKYQDKDSSEEITFKKKKTDETYVTKTKFNKTYKDQNVDIKDRSSGNREWNTNSREENVESRNRKTDTRDRNENTFKNRNSDTRDRNGNNFRGRNTDTSDRNEDIDRDRNSDTRNPSRKRRSSISRSPESPERTHHHNKRRHRSRSRERR